MNDYIDIKSREKELGTNSDVINIFHNVIQEDFFNDPSHILPVDSSILCFEKIKRNKLTRKGNKKLNWKDILDIYDIEYQNYLKSTSSRKNIRSINRFLFGTKSVILTHAVEFENNNPKYSYSLYHKESNENSNYIEASFEYYNNFKKAFDTKLNEKRYTHIIIGSTGWNNNQSESLKCYSKWIKELKDQNSDDFNPYFIGVTWPSYWKLFNADITSKIDYFNKANDADELGMLNLNYFLWKVIMSCVNQCNHDVKVILIGHSFGGRILSRAIHSRLFFKELNNSELKNLKIDRFFIFQGAFNINRYLPIKKGESGIYAIDSPVDLTIATSSLYDQAVPLAFWTSHIGSKKTLKKFNSKSEYSYGKFDLLYGDSFGKISGDLGTKSHKIVISDEYIRNHNDVFGSKAATLMSQFWI